MGQFGKRIDRRPATAAVGGLLAAIALLAGAAPAAAALGAGDGPRPPSIRPQAQPRGLGEVSNDAGVALDVSDDCAWSLRLAARHDLRLPEGWAIHCTGPGLDWDGNSHWGVTCPYDACPEGSGPYVSISNPTYYVVAHELCHANFGNDELMADSCAAEHGASLETSPYR